MGKRLRRQGFWRHRPLAGDPRQGIYAHLSTDHPGLVFLVETESARSSRPRRVASGYGTAVEAAQFCQKEGWAWLGVIDYPDGRGLRAIGSSQPRSVQTVLSESLDALSPSVAASPLPRHDRNRAADYAVTERSVQAANWQGYSWSPWADWRDQVAFRLYGVGTVEQLLEYGPALYRYRSRQDSSQLYYIGKVGVSSRLWGSQRARFEQEYTSALRAAGDWPMRSDKRRVLWGFAICLTRHAAQHEDIEVSWTSLPVTISDEDVKLRERQLFEAHRAHVGAYPHCQWKMNRGTRPEALAAGTFNLEGYILKGRGPVRRPPVWV